MNSKAFLGVLMMCLLAGASVVAKAPPSLEESAGEPIKYVGTEQTERRFYDGGLPHAVGVHRYQAYRANRTNPPEGGLIGWTYIHQPYMAYWNNGFYLQYLSDLKEEHAPPGRTLVMTSKDGRRWSNPRVVFPEYLLPEIKREDVHIPAGMFSVMH
ncbi:MAG: six-hairpin glycosidase, partial [Planctomycetota bacterium]